MTPESAVEHLQVIRTLMERSVLYRRALAPSMLAAGVFGILMAVAGGLAPDTAFLSTQRGFVLAWVATAALAVIAAVIATRRQALVDHEPFWSPPARRVAWAVVPPMVAAAVVARCAVSLSGNAVHFVAWAAPCLWLALHGCALHAAAGQMTRGIRWMGWIHLGGAVVGSIFLPYLMNSLSNTMAITAAHIVMGATFGLSHFTYGLRLVWTERHTPK
ncbi:MAG TPA: hypothetical protein VMF06_10920 [Candidatus Limnocylindria bacterium]|nr:hypothetical protein [Candidatus Limnocylindria bacterium]